ncbi:2-succinyl-6-hydroxy-2,4-cyclohexadiene-1-carboxylate synthase [Alkalibacillus filiformis]|uniref:Putative 2-succinyl-6-hydroxy-2,4-cyclohexadiene-1-carboxylate synthase n=1 Tax=Alkalibacillus filiformis TaxID=200990 RepID=A0ABU0DWU9_9BACI|nr:2-succinyl-6-hydroxy-2,4-cyclohexadiene-1-carboxylate synthase [Alkalibacillus filiformis]MDQ0352938.1 2-succinyl-6-hydroxy-2,4-cyclohexadiene-1-carboxylate synthase [Alkalibacillus filiformis]
MYYTINDNTYYVRTIGEGEPLVMLHGFTGASTTWKDVIEYLSGYRLVLIDLPGHGQTEINNLTDMRQACVELNQLFLEIGLKQFNLLGYSMGGRMSLVYTSMYPETVSSLILVGASPGLQGADRNKRKEQDEKLANFIIESGMESFVDYWESLSLFKTQLNLSIEKRNEIRAERLSQQAEGLALSLRTMGTGHQPNLWPDLAKINPPVLLIVGEFDEKFVKINEEMVKNLRNAKMDIVDETGHAVYVESPRIFGKIVSRFLNHT